MRDAGARRSHRADAGQRGSFLQVSDRTRRRRGRAGTARTPRDPWISLGLDAPATGRAPVGSSCRARRRVHPTIVRADPPRDNQPSAMRDSRRNVRTFSRSGPSVPDPGQSGVRWRGADAGRSSDSATVGRSVPPLASGERALIDQRRLTMKALVYHGPGKKSWEDVPDAAIQDPTDVVVRVDTTTICGTDLHILQGDVAAVTDGRILGHEAVGTVTAVGDAVKGFAVGDRVLVPAITKCGRCEYCQRGHALALPDRRRHRLDLRPPDRRHAGRARCGCPTPTPRSTRSPKASPTSRRSSWPTRCPPATRSACWPAACGRATRSPWSARARWACPPS